LTGPEKDAALDIGFWLREYLESALATVYMSRTSDTAVCLEERTNEANSLGVDIFVSLHHNGNDDSSVKGASCHWYKTEDKALAEAVLNELLANTEFTPWGTGLKNDNFHVLRESNMPAVLVENGFLTNPDDDEYVYGNGNSFGENPINYNRRDIAYAIYYGIWNYFKG